MTDKLTIGVHHIGLTVPGYGGTSSEGWSPARGPAGATFEDFANRISCE